MCSRLYICVVPSAAMPAITKAAPALRSVAFTGAPISLSTPSKKATLPWAVILAPILFSSSVYWKRESHMLSFITLVPFAIDIATPIWGCRSDGNPGYGSVLMFTLFGLLVQVTLIVSPSMSVTSAPISIIFAVIDSKCFVMQFLIVMSPFVATAASMKVPASIWSGTTEYVSSFLSSFTPCILILSVPAPMMFAPILLRKFARSTICGSFAAFSIVDVPSASTAASIAFMVAPTDTMSRYIWLPFSFLAFTSIFPCSASTVAPSCSKAFMCWSIGLAPSLQPPGIPTIACLHLPSSAPG